MFRDALRRVTEKLVFLRVKEHAVETRFNIGYHLIKYRRVPYGHAGQKGRLIANFPGKFHLSNA